MLKFLKRFFFGEPSVEKPQSGDIKSSSPQELPATTLETKQRLSQTDLPQADISPSDELLRLLRIDQPNPAQSPVKRVNSFAPSQVPQQVLTAAQVMVEVKLLNSQHAAWPAILSALNPTNEHTTKDLLIAIRGPHMFTPEVALRVIQVGCENVLLLNAEASAVEALAEARRSLDKIRGSDRY